MTDHPARRKLLALFGIGFATLASAYVLFYLASKGGVWRTTNNGEFVTPAATVASLALVDGEGQRPDTDGTWWLWVVAAEDCGPTCADAVRQLRALHVLLNRDAPRVRRALIQEPGRGDATGTGDPDLERLYVRDSTLTDGIYIVDPIGNLVLFYPYAAAGEPVLHDLERLLRVSRIG